MKKSMLARNVTICLLLMFCIANCKKKDSTAECAVPTIVPFQPYSDPVWHPNGQILGFNYAPQTGVSTNGTAPCTWYMNAVNQDSSGFYLMNRDGSGLRRMTNFYLTYPAWSPDGKWLAFSLGSNIYKMQFSGNAFDTAHIVQLTANGGNFYPSWTASSDTIYFDSNNNAPIGTSFYAIWKMGANGNGKAVVLQSDKTGDIRQPFVGSYENIYYVGYISGKQEIFSSNKSGLNIIQLSFNSGGVKTPKYFQGKVYCENGAINTLSNSGTLMQLVKPAITYDISSAGEIVYSKMNYDITTYSKQNGTLWIMNADGSNNRQFTFNNF